MYEAAHALESLSRFASHMPALTPPRVYEALKRFFPAKNDDFQSDYVEEFAELHDFHIDSEEQLSELLRRRVGQVMEIDRSPMDEYMVRYYAHEFGTESVARRLREGYWFSYPALLRVALELEFGEAYRQYANKRDGIDEPNDQSSDPSTDGDEVKDPL